MNKHAFFTVDYDDSDQSSYKALILKYGDNKEMRFDTGDPLIDWYDYCKFMFDGEASKYDIGSVICSSSIDHWFMGGDKYVEKYINLKDDKTYDFMTDKELSLLSISDLYKFKRCVIQKDMKSFQELKDYYKNNKK